MLKYKKKVLVLHRQKEKYLFYFFYFFIFSYFYLNYDLNSSGRMFRCCGQRPRLHVLPGMESRWEFQELDARLDMLP